MKVLIRVKFFRNSLYEKVILFQKIGVQLPAFQHEAGLFECYIAQACFQDLKPGLFRLVDVTTGMGAAVVQDIPVLFLKETQCVVIVFFSELEGITMRPDEANGNRPVPQDTRGAPAGGHGIIPSDLASRDQHVIVVDQAEEILGKLLRSYEAKEGVNHD